MGVQLNPLNPPGCLNSTKFSLASRTRPHRLKIGSVSLVTPLLAFGFARSLKVSKLSMLPLRVKLLSCMWWKWGRFLELAENTGYENNVILQYIFNGCGIDCIIITPNMFNQDFITHARNKVCTLNWNTQTICSYLFQIWSISKVHWFIRFIKLYWFISFVQLWCGVLLVTHISL